MSPRRSTKAPSLLASEGARRTAAAVLRVMAGLETPTQASAALSLSVNRYYQLEQRALSAMVKALEPLPRGRRMSPTAQMERIVREKQQAIRDASRYQALWRAGQRALGLSPPASKIEASPAGAGKRPRRPRVRAKAVIAQLEAPASGEAVATGGTS